MSTILGGAPIPAGELTPQNATLRICSGPAVGKDFRLDRVRQLLGRTIAPFVTVDIDLTGCETEPSVSRRHAELQWFDGGLYVVDLCSANGTIVDGQRLSCPNGKPSEPRVLRAGSKMMFGSIKAEVVLDER